MNSYITKALDAQIDAINSAAGTLASSAQQAGTDVAAAYTQGADVISGIVNSNMTYLKSQYAIAQGYLAPFIESAKQSMTSGTNMLNDLLGLNGVAAERAATQQVLQGPQVQEAINLGVEAYSKSAGASGMLRSGRLAQELQQFGQQTATSALNERANQLQNYINSSGQIGVNAGSTLGQLGLNYGSQIAYQNLVGGQARQEAILGSANVKAQANLTAAAANANAQLAVSPLLAAKIVGPAYYSAAFGGLPQANLGAAFSGLGGISANTGSSNIFSGYQPSSGIFNPTSSK